MDYILNQIANLNNFLWDRLGLVLIFSAGLFLTLLTKFFQFTHFPLWIKMTLFSLFKKEKTGDLTSITRFQSICTTLGSSVGVGNIVGVATAISLGGSGTVFWMWVASFFGMAVSYGENILTIYFREKDKNGNWLGGPMQTLKNGFSGTKYFSFFYFLALCFCVFCVFASFGIGNISQINAITENVIRAFPLPFLSNNYLYRIIIAVFLTITCFLIITGGLKRVAEFTEKIVPFMVFIFIFCSVTVILKNKSNILLVLKSIIENAFTPSAITSSVTVIGLKEIITNGFKRGLFSNEAGLGSAPIINASSEIIEPAEQGMWGIFQVFCDTVIICSLTAFAILTTSAHLLTRNPSVMASFAFSSVFGSIGEKILAICIFLFAFTSVLGWSQYGVKSMEFLKIPYGKQIYLLLFIIFLPVGCFVNPFVALGISDIFNALMMIPNLISVIFLSPLIVKISNNYLLRRKSKSVVPLLSFDRNLQQKHTLKIKRTKKIGNVKKVHNRKKA